MIYINDKSKQVFIIERNFRSEYFALNVHNGNLTGRILQNSYSTFVRIEDAYDGLILYKSIFGDGLHVYNSSTGHMSSIAREPRMSSNSNYSLVIDI